MIVLLTIAALATPAMAELKLNGYFRTQMIAQQLSESALNTDTMVDQRLRLKLSYGVNDNITIVHYTEIDTPWGSSTSAKYPGGQGGGASADGVNVETKNVYADIKVPNSDIQARVGVQGFSLGFDYAIIGNDIAGITVGTKLSDAAGIKFGYFKGSEGTRVVWDDMDIYAAKLDMKVSEATKVGLGALFVDMNAADATDAAEQWYLALQGMTDLDGIGLSGALAYNGGSTGTLDVGGYFATAKVTAAASDTIKLGARVLFYSSDDDATDGDDDSFNGDVSGGHYEYYKEGSEIFLASKSYNNSGSPAKALHDAAYAGFGLLGIIVNADMKYDGGVYSKLHAGYYQALEDAITGGSTVADKDLGFEVAATVGTKVAEKADLSLTGAFAQLGDFYDGAPNDELFKVNAMLNVSF
jgi:hypothetical protein